MDQVIWKYKLEPKKENIIDMPYGAQVLSVHTQNGNPCIWVLSNIGESLTKRTFEIFVTGHTIPDLTYTGMKRIFCGTFFVEDGLVFHVFEKQPKDQT